jgi:hypothetical protein
VQPADERYRGGPDHPFTRADLHEKFTDCASLVLPAAARSETLRLVESLEDLGEISTLVRALTAGAAQPVGL